VAMMTLHNSAGLPPFESEGLMGLIAAQRKLRDNTASRVQYMSRQLGGQGSDVRPSQKGVRARC
jgi:hypothetical protein